MSIHRYSISRINNFDLIRLFAALQVFFGHGIVHLKIDSVNKDVFNILHLFPGVLIFFSISGFLITSSFVGCYNKSPANLGANIKQYCKNRIYRIYPALWLAFLMLFIVLLSFHIIDFQALKNMHLWGWIIGQISFFQFYTPDLLRNFGVGTPNGSLWTIPVELEFYVILPFIFLICRRISINLKFSILLLLSVLCNFIGSLCNTDSFVDKLFGVSVFPYLYAFLLGGLFYLNWEKWKLVFEGKFIYWLLAYFCFCYIFKCGAGYSLNSIEVFIANILLSTLTISAAFTAPKWGKILCGYDISYGMYIYHMLIINIFVQLGFTGREYYLAYALILVTALSLLSWIFVEKKALSLKYKNLF